MATTFDPKVIFSNIADKSRYTADIDSASGVLKTQYHNASPNLGEVRAGFSEIFVGER